MALEPERRAALLGAKLGALVASTTGPGDRRPSSFPGGAALVDGDRAWVLADTEPARSLGPALAWARAAGAARLSLVAEADAGLLARRASQFEPAPEVWAVEGRTLEPAEADPLPAPAAVDPRLAPWADVLVAAGCDPIVEHARLVGEVEGLEVARVVAGPDGPVLEIGVGRFDREAHALTSADLPTEEALAKVVGLVRRYRHDAGHPLSRLAPERRLRSRLLADPGLVGADHLAPMAPVVEAPDLRTPWPAPATGEDQQGRPLVVVCSTGIDLDLVPAAADARLADGRGARLVLAVPPRDRHPVTVALAGALAEPAEVVAVAP